MSDPNFSHFLDDLTEKISKPLPPANGAVSSLPFNERCNRLSNLAAFLRLAADEFDPAHREQLTPENFQGSNYQDFCLSLLLVQLRLHHFATLATE